MNSSPEETDLNPRCCIRLAYFDIETTDLNAVFGSTLCAVVGEYTKPGHCSPTVLTLPDYKHTRWDDRKLCTELRDLLESYDLVIGYNSINFDMAFLNTRLAAYGERGAVVRRHKDLLYVMRNKYRLNTNRLENVGKFFGIRTLKTKLVPEIWRKAIMGDEKSYKYVVDHCIADVRMLAEVWDRVKDVAGPLK